jgi:hypothetical protein
MSSINVAPAASGKVDIYGRDAGVDRSDLSKCDHVPKPSLSDPLCHLIVSDRQLRSLTAGLRHSIQIQQLGSHIPLLLLSTLVSFPYPIQSKTRLIKAD